MRDVGSVGGGDDGEGAEEVAGCVAAGVAVAEGRFEGERREGYVVCAGEVSAVATGGEGEDLGGHLGSCSGMGRKREGWGCMNKIENGGISKNGRVG